nr:proteasome subunit beta type-7-B-like [Tanacetum cinerariifolium]
MSKLLINIESDADILLNPISDVDTPTSSERFRTPDDVLTESANVIIGRSRGKVGLKSHGFLKTGTTIVDLVFENGVILGADTRATEGPIVADKNCEKIHYMAPNIYCCGAGTAADTEAVTDNISSQLKLHRYHTGRESRVVTALTLLKSHLFRYQGHVSAALVLGGVDVTGPHLDTIYPHGSTDTLPYATMGSGSLAAMAIFESEYREGLTVKEGINLVTKAICSGIFNDLGSGSNVDVCVI